MRDLFAIIKKGVSVKIMKKTIGYIVSGLLILGGSVFAQEGGAQVQFLPQQIIGMVLYPDGQTPVADLPVRLWDVKQKRVLVRSETDEQGRFQIPRQVEGDFMLFVGRLVVDLRILKAAGAAVAQRHDMVMVLPRGMLVPGGRLYDVLLSPALVGATLADSFGSGPTILPQIPEVPDNPDPPPIPPPLPDPLPDPPVVSP
ncbi:MAG: hypothetical protein A2498_09340 [Lentisphaerae bacterium RIFOXYC12_FULL_60_16]|nr:MAG: hypothetical protein A2498_09340 [Lentisphaerae bacterium RIFOXYC12_FULL_60_16]